MAKAKAEAPLMVEVTGTSVLSEKLRQCRVEWSDVDGTAHVDHVSEGGLLQLVDHLRDATTINGKRRLAVAQAHLAAVQEALPDATPATGEIDKAADRAPQ